MDGLRCIRCGHVQWSLLAPARVGSACSLCGGDTRPERRVPGRDRRRSEGDSGAERRGVADRRDVSTLSS